jgi:hypothetical protein
MQTAIMGTAGRRLNSKYNRTKVKPRRSRRLRLEDFQGAIVQSRAPLELDDTQRGQWILAVEAGAGGIWGNADVVRQWFVRYSGT